MMNFTRKFSVAVLAVASSFIGAIAQTQPTTLWGKTIDTDNGDIGVAIAASKGNVYTFSLPQSKNTGSLDIRYDTTKIAEAVKPTTVTTNNTFLLTKTDKDGKLLWSANSTTGDFNNGGDMIATADGGAVVAFKVRQTGNDGTTFYALKDSEGNVKNDTTKIGAKRSYVVGLAKFSAEGKLLWTSDMSVSSAAQPNATYYKEYTPDAISVDGVAEGEQGLYIIGNYRNPVTFTAKDGTKTVITPHNTADWDGDSQKSVGDLYVAKFDTEGNFVKVFTTTGIGTLEFASSINFIDGKLYVIGSIQGKADGDKVSFGNIEVGTYANRSLLAFTLDEDLTPGWVRVYPGEKVESQLAIQNLGSSVSDGNLYVTGQFTGQISNDKAADEKVATTSKTREGFLLSLNAENGDWNNGATSKDSYPESGLSGYFQTLTFSGKPNDLYVWGYDMKTGAFLRKYDKNTLTSTPETDEWLLAKGTMSAQGATKEDDNLYILFRTRESSVSLFDSTVLATTEWGIGIAAYKLPEGFIATSIQNSLVAGNNVTIAPAEGGISISAEKATAVNVYSIDGRLAAKASANEGGTKVSLPAGIYLVSGKKVLVR